MKKVAVLGSSRAYILLTYMFTVFSDMRTVRSEVIL